jgi:hypothetical protein
MCGTTHKELMCGTTQRGYVWQHTKPLFWDTTNWQSLCKQHHDSDKARLEHGSRQRAKFNTGERVVW